MKERLNKLLETESLARNEFANRVGVQRSNITHILDGRNKPSYDFILKTLEAFPAINAEWLIQGTGSMYKTQKTGDLFSNTDTINKSATESVDNKGQLSTKIESMTDIKVGTTEVPNTDKEKSNFSEIFSSKSDKTIERIVILYTDKSFEVYNK